jgi:hypothetical protein
MVLKNFRIVKDLRNKQIPGERYETQRELGRDTGFKIASGLE